MANKPLLKIVFRGMISPGIVGYHVRFLHVVNWDEMQGRRTH